ncbi:hypothetical protein J7E96_31745 [Streptomyces sp. ISL-96]|uniref:hypothetical protein n=1 Tax=Streptomyces sp. ISL-96 TaxID=2819191 RepID=UPI001BE85433|nr:hypothetical protein [Streptomyces sp. ISL-96]MBT2492999.1 hypothetical protein [Streptomyces sp. ISL-96]
MTDQQLPSEEEQQVRRLLTAAAEPSPGQVTTPGAAFTARARRGLLHRRLAVATAAAAVVAAAVAVPSLAGGLFGDDEPVPAASADCLRTAAQKIRDRQEQGYQPVYGTLRAGRIDVDDGVTRSSAFRFDVEGALAGGGTGVPSSGPVTVWYPVAEVQLPPPGRYVLLLDPAERPDRKKGNDLFHFAPEQALPLDDDGRVVLNCAGGAKGAVERERLRAAVTEP